MDILVFRKIIFIEEIGVDFPGDPPTVDVRRHLKDLTGGKPTRNIEGATHADVRNPFDDAVKIFGG
jgi:hypothetical protein